MHVSYVIKRIEWILWDSASTSTWDSAPTLRSGDKLMLTIENDEKFHPYWKILQNWKLQDQSCTKLFWALIQCLYQSVATFWGPLWMI
jgi:hypothetical protein